MEIKKVWEEVKEELKMKEKEMNGGKDKEIDARRDGMSYKVNELKKKEERGKMMRK